MLIVCNTQNHNPFISFMKMQAYIRITILRFKIIIILEVQEKKGNNSHIEYVCP